jgi:hypothetical protein
MGEVNGTMPPMQGPVGFMGFGILATLLQAALVIAFVWLIIKLSRVLDAYEAKLKAKT